MEARGDRARPAGPHGLTVHTNDGDHLPQGAGQEALVGAVEIARLERGLLDGNALLAGDAEDDGARDPFEQSGARWRRPEDTVLHREDVARGALDHLAGRADHDRLVA